METLRWTLLGLGLLLLLVVFLYSRGVFSSLLARFSVKPKVSANPIKSKRKEPVLDGASAAGSAPDPVLDADDLQVSTVDGGSESAADNVVDTASTKVVAIRLVPGTDKAFPAEALVMALRNKQLRHGRHGVFHRLDDGQSGEGRFCVASLVEPGSFDLSNLHDATYPGVSFFMLLPQSHDGVAVFDDMMTVARALASELDGVLLDEVGTRLSIQRERYLREEVIEFDRLHRTTNAVSGSFD